MANKIQGLTRNKRQAKPQTISLVIIFFSNNACDCHADHFFLVNLSMVREIVFKIELKVNLEGFTQLIILASRLAEILLLREKTKMLLHLYKT